MNCVFLFTGAVVQVQDRGMGLFGCGTPSKEGVVRVEAMRWMTEVLNREWEDTMFLPNISIGECSVLQKQESSF